MKEFTQEEKSDLIAKEPEVCYQARPISSQLDNDEYYAKLRSELQETYTADKAYFEKHPIPKGYLTLEEFDKLFQKKLEERYAES